MGKNDIVFFLGDFSLKSTVERTKEFINALNGKIYKIWGNHTSFTYKIYREEIERQYGKILDGKEVYPITYNDKLTFLGPDYLCKIDGKFVYMRHMAPLIFDHAQHNGLCLSGHSHSNCEQINPNYKGQKILDVGVDNFPNGPVSWEEILRIMENKEYTPLDHHENTTIVS